jgi:SNF2 family DNA or RNA helicase
MTKAEKIVDIIKNNKKGKFLIFSDHDGSFLTIKTMLHEINIDCEQIRGNSKNIEKKLSAFKNNENNVIFLNSRHNGAGINLQEATDIILYHNMADGIKEQIIGRANRIGRIHPLNVHLLQI